MNLFTQKQCAYCGKSFQPKKSSPVLADGFIDQDNGQMSHFGDCQLKHYKKKNTTEHKHKYSEKPLFL
jgi:hypothetical protein